VNILLYPNQYTGRQAQQAIQCRDALEARGHACTLCINAVKSDDMNGTPLISDEYDLVVSLGGDGSVLRAAQTALRLQKPLLGINSGRLGYLCAMDLGEIDRFDELLSACEPTERTVLECISGKNVRYAFNDVVFAKMRFGETAELFADIDGTEALHVRGDGLIISSPTGSTAYNLSAGGPVSEPDAPILLLTPICAHAVDSHPTVLRDSHVIGVRERNGRAQIIIDGETAETLQTPVIVRKAEHRLKLYRRRCGGAFQRVTL
jgi:NAD+ kinase